MNAIRAYAELPKSRIVAMVLVTAAAAFLAAGGRPAMLLVTLAGTALLAAGTNALNEVLEHAEGMTIVGDTLYVSDVTGVRKFDRRTGAPRGFVPIPGATFLNDLTNDGRSVYASDTGLAMGPGVTFLRTGTEAIWRIDGDRATKIAAGVDLKEPNGLLFTDGQLLVVSFGAADIGYDAARDRLLVPRAFLNEVTVHALH